MKRSSIFLFCFFLIIGITIIIYFNSYHSHANSFKNDVVINTNFKGFDGEMLIKNDPFFMRLSDSIYVNFGDYTVYAGKYKSQVVDITLPKKDNYTLSVVVKDFSGKYIFTSKSAVNYDGASNYFILKFNKERYYPDILELKWK